MPYRPDLLKRLAEAHGPSSREDAIRAIVRPEFAATCDRVEEDALGNVTGVRVPAPGLPRLMLAAHMDEISLMVTHVDDGGYIRVATVGGWDVRTLVGQRVVVHGRSVLPGIVGTTPVHLMDDAAKGRAPRVEDLGIDIGLPADEVRALVRRGDMATRTRELVSVGNLVTAKGLDNRVGVAVMLEAMGAATPTTLEVHAVATSQEEVGLRGAKVRATAIAPHIALAIDTCPSDDGPGGNRAPTTRLGGGAAIRIMDASAICAPALVDLLEQLAIKRGIPHQFHAANRGGTDTGAMQLAGEGTIAGCVSIPTRYVHTSVEACHPADIDACIALVAALIEEGHRCLPASSASSRTGQI